MTPHQTIAVAVRLFAIWLAVTLVTNLISYNAQFHWQEQPNKLLATALIVAVIGLACLALWFFPLSVARRLLPAASLQSASPAPSAPPDMWLAMGCALLGLWVLTSALPLLARDCMILTSADFATDTSEVRHWLAYHLAGALIGGWLTLGAKGFRRFFWWAQHAGIDKPSN
jgi:hypothetical protein